MALTWLAQWCAAVLSVFAKGWPRTVTVLLQGLSFPFSGKIHESLTSSPPTFFPAHAPSTGHDPPGRQCFR